jgi:hypothetical protein
MAAKVKSLDHTRFVITADNGHRQGTTMYYAGGRALGNGLGDWANDLGGAVVYNDLHEAQKLMKEIREHHKKISFHDSTLEFDVKLVQRKDVMVARLKFDGETI